MILKRDPTKALQIGFLALLVISTAQVAWWIADQATLARDDRDRVEALYESDALAVTAMFAQATEELPAFMPHLEIDAVAGTASVREDAMQALDQGAASRINRYTWEGGFFLLVLLGGMAILTRTIRHDADLRRRQQNFLAAVSHEFKSPLTSIRQLAEMLQAGRVPSEERRQRYYDVLVEQSSRLSSLVTNILDLARIEEGRKEFRFEPVDVGELLEELTTTTQHRVGHEGFVVEAIEADQVILRDQKGPLVLRVP